MSYSFFGTCANDYKYFLECLDSMTKQTVRPLQIILVYSGDTNIENQIKKKLSNTTIKLVYIPKKLSRVNSLNLAVENSLAKYSFRFDARTRFSSDYAEQALKVLEDPLIDASVVGGAPFICNENESYQASLCSRVLGSFYIFFYPNHRKTSFTGYVSSVYLGCFHTELIKEIKYRVDGNLISEDSLIISDFLDKGYKTYIKSTINVSYICRSSFYRILKLFNTYGYCRANTILVSKKMFLSSRHLFVFVNLVFLLVLLIKKSIFFILFLPLILFLCNIVGEFICFKSKASILISICATLCQFFWIVGFFWKLMTIFSKKNIQSNFIS